MPDLNDDTLSWDTPKNIGMVSKVASVATQILVNQYSYHDVVRMVKAVRNDAESGSEDDDETEDEMDTRLVAKSDDPLASLLCTAIESLETLVREGRDELTISPATSVAELFNKESKHMKPRLFVAFDLGSDTAGCTGCATVCNFVQSDDFLTDRFTDTYLRRHKIPELSGYLMVDVISARKPPSGLLLLLQIYTTTFRSKYDGFCFVAISKKGKELAKNFGMQTHSFKEGGMTRELAWLPSDELSISHLNKKLRLGGANAKVLTQICTRTGLTSRTRGTIYPRC